MSDDYYAILGVERTATKEEIKKAFRRKASEMHPDKGGADDDAMAAVNVAYEVLSDDERRAAYDATGEDSRGMLMTQAQQGVAQLILQFIQGQNGNGDIMTKVVAELCGQLAAAEENVSEGERILASFQRASGKLKFKGKGKDYASAMIAARIDELKDKIRRARQNVERIKLGIECAKDYDYEVSWNWSPPQGPDGPVLRPLPWVSFRR